MKGKPKVVVPTVAGLARRVTVLELALERAYADRDEWRTKALAAGDAVEEYESRVRQAEAQGREDRRTIGDLEGRLETTQAVLAGRGADESLGASLWRWLTRAGDCP